MSEPKTYKFNKLFFAILILALTVVVHANENNLDRESYQELLTQEDNQEEFDPLGAVIEQALEIEKTNGSKDAFEFLNNHYLRGNIDILLFSGYFAHRAKLINEAESVLRELLAKDPDHVEGNNTLGYILADSNIKLNEALKLIEKALNASPESAHILDSYAWVQYRLGNLEYAEQILINEAFPKFNGIIPAESMAHLGVIFWEQGKRNDAIKVWQRAFMQEPNDKYLIETIERYATDTKIY